MLQPLVQQASNKAHMIQVAVSAFLDAHLASNLMSENGNADPLSKKGSYTLSQISNRIRGYNFGRLLWSTDIPIMGSLVRLLSKAIVVLIAVIQ